MRFSIIGPFKDNFYNLMRNISYLYTGTDEKTGQMSFVNPVGTAGRHGYPRFHIYLTIKKDSLIFDLHLDQKKPSYEGTTAHSGEYDGEVVAKETERIKEILKNEPVG